MDKTPATRRGKYAQADQRRLAGGREADRAHQHHQPVSGFASTLFLGQGCK